MELNEIKGIHNLQFEQNPFHQNPHNPSDLMDKMIKVDQNNPLNSCRFNKLMFPTANVFSPNTSCYSNDTVLDDDQFDGGHRGAGELNIAAERKLRRMISNRESARRSRMRKKKQIEELQFQVSQLEGSNRQMSEKIIQLLECNQQILHENAELKNKVSSLQILLTDFLTPLKSLEDVFCSRRRGEGSDSGHHLTS